MNAITSTESLTVTLSNVGNPDFRQDPTRPLPGVRNGTAIVQSLTDAVKVCRAYIAKFDLGGGNWTGGKVFNADGVQIARVSYNGRLWKLNGEEIPQAGMKTVAECERDGWR